MRPQTLPRPLPVRDGRSGVNMATFDARLHASAALADFEQEGEVCRRWRRRPAADFRIPLYQDTLDRHPWHAPESCLLVPDEPRVHDKVLRQVQIRLLLPSSEIASCLRQPTSRDNPLGCGTAWRPDNLVFHVGGIDLRTMTGDGLRRRIAHVLGLPKRHVKLQPDGVEGGREDDELGPCILSAYARESGGGGAAVRASLDPDWESLGSDCTLSCR